MYESPISMFTKQLRDDLDNGILQAVHRVGIVVDKAELLKALSYDRDQYEKGFQDGISHNVVRHARWIAQDDTFTRFMCSECELKNYDGYGKYCPNCGARMDLEDAP